MNKNSNFEFSLIRIWLSFQHLIENLLITTAFIVEMGMTKEELLEGYLGGLTLKEKDNDGNVGMRRI